MKHGPMVDGNVLMIEWIIRVCVICMPKIIKFVMVVHFLNGLEYCTEGFDFKCEVMRALMNIVI